ncbi:hypothetical protein D3C85_519490 [compost metagenome]
MPHGEHGADQHLDDFHRHEGLQKHGRQGVQRAAPRRAPQGCRAARHGRQQDDARVDGHRADDGAATSIQHAHGGRHAALGRRDGLAGALMRHPAIDAGVDAHGDHPQQQEGNDGGHGGQCQGQQGLACRAAVHAQAAPRSQHAHVVHALAHVGGNAGQETLHAIGHACLQTGYGGVGGGRLCRARRAGGGRFGPRRLRAQLVHQRLARLGILQQVGQRGGSQRRRGSSGFLGLQGQGGRGGGLPEQRQATQHRRQQQGRQPGSFSSAPPETGGMVAEQGRRGCCRCG